MAMTCHRNDLLAGIDEHAWNVPCKSRSPRWRVFKTTPAPWKAPAF